MSGMRVAVVSFTSKLLNAPLKFTALAVMPRATRSLHDELKRALQKHENIAGWAFYAEALIFAEDVRFFSHRGLDIVAIGRAIQRITFYGNRQGASTIEQQLVRTLTGDYRPTLLRKIKEALLASTLWDRVDKVDILRSYLAVAHLGTGISGLGAAIANIKIPSAFEYCRAVYMIAHLRYPLPLHAIDHGEHRRARRTQLVASMLSLHSEDMVDAQRSNLVSIPLSARLRVRHRSDYWVADAVLSEPSAHPAIEAACSSASHCNSNQREF